jgi:hypothetical protein
VSSAPILESLSLLSRGGFRNRITGDHIVVPATLFNGSAPRLSRLKLRKCEISWKSPLLKGLRYLEMLSPPAKARPDLTTWLDALDEMLHLKTLALHSFSPTAPPLPFDVKRTATLPSRTHLEIFSSPEDCAIVLAHLNLPALTVLSVTVNSTYPTRDKMQTFLPYVAQHAHGPQDTQPLQSALIVSEGKHATILAWSVPDINVRVREQPTLPTETPPTRVAVSFTSKEWFNPTTCLDLISAAMAVLPLDGLITLIVLDFIEHPNKQFWLRHAPQWPLLRHVQLAAGVQSGFKDMLLDYNRRRKNPLLPSLKELALAGDVTENWESAFMERVEQGVPMELLDLRMCRPPDMVALVLPSKNLANILRQEKTSGPGEQMMSAWKTVARLPFREDVNSLSEFYLYNEFCEQDG